MLGPLLTKNQIAIRIIAIISSAEVVIMLLLSAFPSVSEMTSVAIDGALLIVFATPPLYLMVVKPFVDARDEALAHVNHLATTDPLTRLANRRQVTEQIQRVTRGSVAHGIPAALLLVDLDGFKLVNDVHGHDAGDAVLVEIATRLRSIVRAGDFIGRLGGDEFVVLLDRLEADERLALDAALQVSGKLLEAVNLPFEFDREPVRLSASIGVRLLGFEALDASRALREADVAMYRAKQSGKGRAEAFEPPRSALAACS